VGRFASDEFEDLDGEMLRAGVGVFSPKSAHGSMKSEKRTADVGFSAVRP
jgi:hypothetical protein